jgi:hypothetical protein
MFAGTLSRRSQTIPSSTFPGGVGVAATYLETGRRDVLQMGGR